MMSDFAIHVENLGKQYRIGGGERYHALRDVLARGLSFVETHLEPEVLLVDEVLAVGDMCVLNSKR